VRNKTVSVRLDSETLERLGGIAKAMDRPRAWLMAHAIQRYVEERAHLGVGGGINCPVRDI
jgi:predicted transcriptional regulator